MRGGVGFSIVPGIALSEAPNELAMSSGKGNVEVALKGTSGQKSSLFLPRLPGGYEMITDVENLCRL